MKKLLPFLLLFSGFISCQSSTAVYDTSNDTIAFETREEIVAYFKRCYNIAPEDLYFFDRQREYELVYRDVMRFAGSCYGLALNDSVLTDNLFAEKRPGFNMASKTKQDRGNAEVSTVNPLYKKTLRNIYGDRLSLNRARPVVVIEAYSRMRGELQKDINRCKKEAARQGKEFDYVFMVTDIPRYNPEGYFNKTQ